MRSFVRGTAWLAGIFGAIGLLLYLFVFDTWLVPTFDNPQSNVAMLPALQPDDRILTLRGRQPLFGELARCVSPDPTQAFIVGRVMGVPGDLVEIDNGVVVTNGKPVPTRHQCPAVTVLHPVTQSPVLLQCNVSETAGWSYQYLTTRDYGDGHHAAQIDAGRLYLVSDNRHMHKDSRDFGPVEASTCEHVVYRLWGSSFLDGSRRFSLLW